MELFAEIVNACFPGSSVKLFEVLLLNRLKWPEAYSEPCKYKMKRFAEVANSLKPFTIFAKRSILNALQGSEFASNGCFWLFMKTENLYLILQNT